MQLTPAERRKIIEGLLDLDILADMNQYVKGQLGALKVSIGEHESLLKIAHEKINLKRNSWSKSRIIMQTILRV
jgi:flagellar biosynthesis chaperone FliJ